MNISIQKVLIVLVLSISTMQHTEYRGRSSYGYIAYETPDPKNPGAVIFSEKAGPQNPRLELSEKDGYVEIYAHHPEHAIYRDPTFWDFVLSIFGIRLNKDLDYLPPYFLEISKDGKAVTLKTKTKILAVMPVDKQPIIDAHKGIKYKVNKSEFTVAFPTK